MNTFTLAYRFSDEEICRFSAKKKGRREAWRAAIHKVVAACDERGEVFDFDRVSVMEE